MRERQLNVRSLLALLVLVLAACGGGSSKKLYTRAEADTTIKLKLPDAELERLLGTLARELDEGLESTAVNAVLSVRKALGSPLTPSRTFTELEVIRGSVVSPVRFEFSGSPEATTTIVSSQEVVRLVRRMVGFYEVK